MSFLQKYKAFLQNFGAGRPWPPLHYLQGMEKIRFLPIQLKPVFWSSLCLIGVSCTSSSKSPTAVDTTSSGTGSDSTEYTSTTSLVLKSYLEMRQALSNAKIGAVPENYVTLDLASSFLKLGETIKATAFSCSSTTSTWSGCLTELANLAGVAFQPSTAFVSSSETLLSSNFYYQVDQFLFPMCLALTVADRAFDLDPNGYPEVGEYPVLLDQSTSERVRTYCGGEDNSALSTYLASFRAQASIVVSALTDQSYYEQRLEIAFNDDKKMLYEIFFKGGARSNRWSIRRRQKDLCCGANPERFTTLESALYRYEASSTLAQWEYVKPFSEVRRQTGESIAMRMLHNQKTDNALLFFDQKNYQDIGVTYLLAGKPNSDSASVDVGVKGSWTYNGNTIFSGFTGKVACIDRRFATISDDGATDCDVDGADPASASFDAVINSRGRYLLNIDPADVATNLDHFCQLREDQVLSLSQSTFFTDHFTVCAE